MEELKRQFKKKVLAIDPSSIESHLVKSYTAYHIKEGQALIRLYPNKTTILPPFNEIGAKDRGKYGLRDNSDRYLKHELPTKGPKLKQEYLKDGFIGLIKKAFIYT